MRDDEERLRDVHEAIERIERYADRGRETFDSDELIQTWVLHHLQIIGEAVRAISAEKKEEADSIEWSKIVGMRNILVHNYFAIDKDLVWAVIENDLPQLKKEISKLLSASE